MFDGGCVTYIKNRSIMLTFFLVFFEEARVEARKLDAEFAETGEIKGLLHGVPISVKDMSAFFRPQCAPRG